MTLSLPRRLRPGDTVAITSTSSPVTAEGVEKTRRYFEARGYAVKVAPHALANTGFLAGPPEMRAGDLNALLRDPEVRLIVTAMGGAGAVHLLPLVDYAAMARDPKMIIGLSNPAILLNAMTAMSGVPTLHGPNGVDFGYEDPTPFTEANFWPIVAEELALPYTFLVSDRIRVLRAGPVAEGPLYGGHMRTNRALIGTRWAPDWRGAILFIEEVGTEPYRVDTELWHLKLAGVLDAIAGLVVGVPVDCEDKTDPQGETFEDVILRVCAGLDFPVIANVPLGHTPDKLTLPIGVRARVNCSEPAFELLESPTC